MLSQEELDKLTPGELQRLAAANQPRRFVAAELLFAWIAEPEVWEKMPILRADDENLRGNVLQVPILGEDGSRLKFVSPRQVEDSRMFAEQWLAMIGKVRQAQQRSRKPELTVLDQKVKDLYDALTTFKRLTYDPSRTGDGRNWSREEVLGLDEDWSGLEKNILRPGFALDKKSDLAAAAPATGLAMRQLKAAWTQNEASAQDPVKNSEPLAAAMRQSSAKLAACLADRATKEAGSASPGDANLAFQAARVANAPPRSIGACSTPAKPPISCRPWNPPPWKPTATAAKSIPGSACKHCSWVPTNCSVATRRARFDRIARSWDAAQKAYRNRDLADRQAKFSDALERFSAAVREMSNSIEPARRELVIQERDDGLLAKTAYPAAIVADVEFYYNRTDPFFWSGCFSLVAVGVLALSFLIDARKPLFWIGIATLVLAITLVAGGFLTRMYLTDWAPVTSMYETIVWVAMCVAVLTIWVTFLPLLSSLGRVAWSLTALPGTAQARSLGDGSCGESLPRWWPAARMFAPHAPLRHLSLGALHSRRVSARQLEFGISPGLVPAAGRYWFQPADRQFAAGLALFDLRNGDIDVVCTAVDPCGAYLHPADYRHGPAIRWRRSGRESLPLARRGLGWGGGHDVGCLGGLQGAVP